MKKYNVFKILGIVIALTILLSYFIPQTTVNYGSVAKGDINPVSIIDTFSNSITSFNVFISQFIFILICAVFYGILHKTGEYEKVVNQTAVINENNKGLFVVISVLTLGIITAAIGDIFPMLIFVPFVMAVAVKLGYKKVSAIAMSVGAILIGSTGSLYTNITNQMLSTKPETYLIYKIIILVVGLVSLIGFILVFTKPEDTKLTVSKENGKVPIIISFISILLFTILGMLPWNGFFKLDLFEDLFKDITAFKVGKISLYNAFVGNSVSAFGTWQLFDIFVLIAIVSVLLVITYKIKFDDFLELSAKAVKKALPYALIIIIANIVLVNVYSSGWITTLISALAGKKFNLFTAIGSAFISGIVYPDYSYGLQFTVSTIMYTISGSKKYYDILAIAYQAIYSAALLISPTSVLVLIALHYSDVKYTEWIKYIWKYFLILFASLVIVLFVAKYGFTVSSILCLIIVLAVSTLLVVRRINNVKSTMPKKEVKVEKKETKKTTKKVSKKK